MRAAEVRDRVSIVDFLRRHGAEIGHVRGHWVENQAIRCPFHRDENASATVSRRKGLFNCFTCGMAGDIITLTEKLQGTDFRGAMEWLEREFRL